MRHGMRIGDHGVAVKQLQTMLDQRGAGVPVTGTFGILTDRAVRDFQKHNKLAADGIVGSATWIALSRDEPRSGRTFEALESDWSKVLLYGENHFAPPRRMPPLMRPVGPGVQTISSAGLDFIYVHEAWKGHSNRLHWPGGASGVTLGPGYDMKGRTAAEIQSTMTAIGVVSTVAAEISAASGLSGADAQMFANKNRQLVLLSAQQERSLLDYIVPNYVGIVQRFVKIPLTQTQFDAMVSFAYNPGGRMKSVSALLNAGKTSEAMNEIKKAVTSGGKTLGGLVKRRNHEVNLYVHSVYAMSPTE